MHHPRIATTLRLTTMVCAACAGLSGPAAAQLPLRGLDDVESSTNGIGANLSVFVAKGSLFQTGFEVGYAKMGRLEQYGTIGLAAAGSVFQADRTSTRLWRATLVAKRDWAAFGQSTRFYAVGGSGLYMGQTTTETLK